MKRWEYKLISTADVAGEGMMKRKSRERIEAHLNDLGDQGWEIVTADFWDDWTSEREFAALARREKPAG